MELIYYPIFILMIVTLLNYFLNKFYIDETLIWGSALWAFFELWHLLRPSTFDNTATTTMFHSIAVESQANP